MGMRCDLHVHTRHSGMCNIPGFQRFCRESYNPPDAVYETLKRRGMDLVTVTDHDSIDAAEELRRHPDFFLSEEVTCTTPCGTEIHVGAYGIEERHHLELQRRRNDVPSLAAYLREQHILFSINHVFSSLTGRRTELDFEMFEELFPALETLNGHIPAANNRSAARLAEDWQKAPVAGSDAHTLGTLALTYTEVPGATDIRSYLEAVRQGFGQAGGASGNYAKLTQAVLGIGSSLVRERPWAIVLTPLMLIVPLVTLGNYFRELGFHARWSRVVWPSAIPEAGCTEPAEG
ncbi:MAG TPA: PHP-associated domain-containing protein [Bryobacteraceae bacterium]|nr:PHP-associated domain-containing protein [Bryobacteraceae bacterium]